jgi:hypothetical protein
MIKKQNMAPKRNMRHHIDAWEMQDMKKRVFSCLLCLVLAVSALSACSSSGTGTVSPASQASAATASDASAGLTVKVTDASGAPVEGAYVSLTDRQTLATAAVVSGADGTAAIGKAAAGMYFLSVTAAGCHNSFQDLDYAGDSRTVACALTASVSFKRYLMAFNATLSADQKPTVYLAQSDDGIAWELFPGFEPFEGSGAAVMLKDNVLCVYSETQVKRYFVDTGVWDFPRAYCFYNPGIVDQFLDDQSKYLNHELNKDPGFFADRDGKLIHIGAQDNAFLTSYLDAFAIKPDEDLSLVGWAEEMDGSGLSWYYGENRYLYKDKFNYTKDDARMYTHPTVIVGPETYYLLQTGKAGIMALQGTDKNAAFEPVTALGDALLYAGANNGSTGLYDKNTGKYTLYIAGPGETPSLARYTLDTLESAVDPGAAAPVDLSFLGGAPLTFSGPRVWDTTVYPVAPVQPELKTIGFSDSWAWNDTFIKNETGVVNTNATTSQRECTLQFSADAYLVYNYRDIIADSLTYACEVKPGGDLLTSGMAYCWKPFGAELGGYMFTTDGAKWTLSLFTPVGSAYMHNFGTIQSIETVASGDYAVAPEGCTLTVRFSEGRHALYINGEKVGEYQDTPEKPGFGCGYIGFLCESGAADATVTFKPVRLLLQ